MLIYQQIHSGNQINVYASYPTVSVAAIGKQAAGILVTVLGRIFFHAFDLPWFFKIVV